MKTRHLAQDRVDHDRKPNPNWELTARDKRILQHIWAYDGLLADYQVKELEFTGLRQAQDRLMKLFHNGYLARPSRRERAKYDSMVYWLTEMGAEEVAGGQGIELKDLKWHEEPPWSKIEHNLMVNDFRLVITEACRKNDEFALSYWVNERTFNSERDEVEFVRLSGKRERRAVIPDGYFVIDRQGVKEFRSRLLLELDMGKEDNLRFSREKVRPAIAYLRSEIYKLRFGSNAGRWLVVTTSELKLQNLREATVRAAGRDAPIFYFTAFNQVTAETVLTEPIWYRGEDSEPIALFPAQR